MCLGDDGVDDDAQRNSGKMIAWSKISGASWNEEEERPEVLWASADLGLRRRHLPGDP
jgi:hypothetical protein